MNKDNIMNAMAEMNETVLNETDALRTGKKQAKGTVKTVVGMAVGLAAVFAVGFFVKNADRLPEKTDIEPTGVIYETKQTIDGKKIENGKNYVSDASASYNSPNPGETVLHLEVRDAVKELKGSDTALFVGMTIFKCTGEKEAENGMDILDALDGDSDEMKAEIERLKALGYEVGYHEMYAYQADGSKSVFTFVYGLFTPETIESFPVNENYGYAFYFPKNGDGTFVEY